MIRLNGERWHAEAPVNEDAGAFTNILVAWKFGPLKAGDDPHWRHSGGELLSGQW